MPCDIWDILYLKKLFFICLKSKLIEHPVFYLPTQWLADSEIQQILLIFTLDEVLNMLVAIFSYLSEKFALNSKTSLWMMVRIILVHWLKLPCKYHTTLSMKNAFLLTVLSIYTSPDCREFMYLGHVWSSLTRPLKQSCR